MRSACVKTAKRNGDTVIQFDFFLYSPPEFNIIITPYEGGDSFQKNQIPRMDKLFHLVGEHQPDDMNEI